MNKKELIVTIVNIGFADEVMDQARKCGVKGGTINSFLFIIAPSLCYLS